MQAASSGLFSPLCIGSKSTKNRFILPAMQLGWTDNNGPAQSLVNYYERCAAGGISIVITEGLCIDHPSATWNDGGYLIERTAPAWAKVVDAVRPHGSLVLMQLFHEGAIRQEGKGGPFPDYPSLSPSGLFDTGKASGRACTRQDLVEIRESYVRAALLAQRIGADGIELHCAHGYFLDQFLWPHTNVRDDEYGGDIRGRARFPAEIIAAIRAAAGPDFIISVRFSQWKEVDYDAKIVTGPEEVRALVDTFVTAGADLLHVSARRFFLAEFEGSSLGLAGWVKRFSPKPVIANGSVGLSIDVMGTFFAQDLIEGTTAQSVAELERRFTGDEFDLVSVGRSVIGDQAWVNKVQARRFDDIQVFNRSMLSALAELWDPGVIGEAHGMEKAYGA